MGVRFHHWPLFAPLPIWTAAFVRRDRPEGKPVEGVQVIEGVRGEAATAPLWGRKHGRRAAATSFRFAVSLPQRKLALLLYASGV
jgi:hypothetical protein